MQIAKAFTLLIALAPLCALSAQEPLHVLVDGGWAREPIVSSAISKRIVDAADQYKQYAPIPRFALFDIAYPASEVELKEMAGFAVMLISIVSQEAGELPPSRIFVSLSGKEYPLQLIHSSTSKSQGELVSRVLGSNRWDGLLLLPIYLTQDGADVTIDFATNRKGFVVQRFSGQSPKILGSSDRPISMPNKAAPPEAVMKLVSREYPGFVEAP